MLFRSPRKRNTKKAKWLSEEALQIAVKRKEVKSKGEKERYTHLNAEFQRIARRDKKAFLTDQCKEQRKIIEWERLAILQGNYRTQGNTSCKDGLNKGQKWYGPNRNRRYLRRGGKKTQKNCTKRILRMQIIMMV